MPLVKLTADQIKAFREKEQCGLHEAKQHLMRQAMIAAVQDATTITDLREVLLYMLRNGEPPECDHMWYSEWSDGPMRVCSKCGTRERI